jgi:cytochrome P450
MGQAMGLHPDSTAGHPPLRVVVKKSPGELVVNTLRRLQGDPLAFVRRMDGEPGDVVQYRVWRQDIFLVKHPDLIRDVLVTNQHDYAKGAGLQWAKRFLGEGLITSEGEFHTRQRRLSQPAFHRQRIGSYAAVMAEYAAQTGDRARRRGSSAARSTTSSRSSRASSCLSPGCCTGCRCRRPGASTGPARGWTRSSTG